MPGEVTGAQLHGVRAGWGRPGPFPGRGMVHPNDGIIDQPFQAREAEVFLHTSLQEQHTRGERLGIFGGGGVQPDMGRAVIHAEHDEGCFQPLLRIEPFETQGDEASKGRGVPNNRPIRCGIRLAQLVPNPRVGARPCLQVEAEQALWAGGEAQRHLPADDFQRLGREDMHGGGWLAEEDIMGGGQDVATGNLTPGAGSRGQAQEQFANPEVGCGECGGEQAGFAVDFGILEQGVRLARFAAEEERLLHHQRAIRGGEEAGGIADAHAGDAGGRFPGPSRLVLGGKLHEGMPDAGRVAGVDGILRGVRRARPQPDHRDPFAGVPGGPGVLPAGGAAQFGGSGLGELQGIALPEQFPAQGGISEDIVDKPGSSRIEQVARGRRRGLEKGSLSSRDLQNQAGLEFARAGVFQPELRAQVGEGGPGMGEIEDAELRTAGREEEILPLHPRETHPRDHRAQEARIQRRDHLIERAIAVGEEGAAQTERAFSGFLCPGGKVPDEGGGGITAREGGGGGEGGEEWGGGRGRKVHFQPLCIQAAAQRQHLTAERIEHGCTGLQASERLGCEDGQQTGGGAGRAIGRLVGAALADAAQLGGEEAGHLPLQASIQRGANDQTAAFDPPLAQQLPGLVQDEAGEGWLGEGRGEGELGWGGITDRQTGAQKGCIAQLPKAGEFIRVCGEVGFRGEAAFDQPGGLRRRKLRGGDPQVQPGRGIGTVGEAAKPGLVQPGCEQAVAASPLLEFGGQQAHAQRAGERGGFGGKVPIEGGPFGDCVRGGIVEVGEVQGGFFMETGLEAGDGHLGEGGGKGSAARQAEAAGPEGRFCYHGEGDLTAAVDQAGGGMHGAEIERGFKLSGRGEPRAQFFQRPGTPDRHDREKQDGGGEYQEGQAVETQVCLARGLGEAAFPAGDEQAKLVRSHGSLRLKDESGWSVAHPAGGGGEGGVVIMPRVHVVRWKKLVFGIVMVLAGAACAPQVLERTPSPLRSPLPAASVTPWQSATPARQTPSPGGLAGQELLPSPTATPRSHTIAKGEDLTGIAIRYGLTVAELRAANPDVNPNLLRVGATLVIPAGSQMVTPSAPVLPTPLPATLSGPVCYAQADDSLTCLALAHNEGESGQESLALRLRVRLADGRIVEGVMYALLDRLPPGGTVPFALQMEGETAGNFGSAVELLRSYPLEDVEERYTAVDMSGLSGEIGQDGSSAVVSGSLSVEADARRLRLVAWGWDAENRLAAVRVWEAEGGVPAGQAQDMRLQLFSLGAPLARLEWRAEALR